MNTWASEKLTHLPPQPVVDDFLPSLTLSVSWSKEYYAKLGNTLEPENLQSQPSITLHDAISGAPASHVSTRKSNEMTYIITLTDPDAPSRDNPTSSEWCHWIAANVSLSTSQEPSAHDQNMGHGEEEVEEMLSILPFPSNNLMPMMRSSPDTLISYMPPSPPPKTGKHRYVFVVFAPRNGTSEPLHLSRPKERQHWGTGRERSGVRDWATSNGLVAVGANFIYAENKRQ